MLAPDVLLTDNVKRGGLQNQSFTSETGKYYPVPIGKILPTCSGALSILKDPVVAPAGIGLRAGSTQRPSRGVAGPGIDHTGPTRRASLERGM